MAALRALAIALLSLTLHCSRQDNFKRWNDALQTKNAQTVANMYTAEPSFLPTVSGDHIKRGGVGTPTEDYFVEFVKKNPFGTITDDSVQVFSGGDAYLHSGLYTFELGEADARTPVEARFSYVWQKDGGDWKIAHHHSSVRPGVAPAKPDMVKMATLARVSSIAFSFGQSSRPTLRVAGGACSAAPVVVFVWRC